MLCKLTTTSGQCCGFNSYWRQLYEIDNTLTVQRSLLTEKQSEVKPRTVWELTINTSKVVLSVLNFTMNQDLQISLSVQE